MSSLCRSASRSSVHMTGPRPLHASDPKGTPASSARAGSAWSVHPFRHSCVAVMAWLVRQWARGWGGSCIFASPGIGKEFSGAVGRHCVRVTSGHWQEQLGGAPQ